MLDMAVIMSDGLYQVRKRPHPWTYDADGVKIPAALDAPGPARPGAAHLRTPGDRDNRQGVWVLRLDPAEWPVGDGDQVLRGGRTWTISGPPKLCKHNVDSALDYVEAVAALDPPTIT